MREIEQLKEEIIKEYPRLDKKHSFKFSCHPGVACFNECCADVNIFLTPYDIIRLKNRLGIRSDEFISKYTVSPFDKNLKYPIMLLKLQDNDTKSCHFVGEKGCTVYEDRPWACRMYPLGMASPSEGHKEVQEDFFFLLQEGGCKGFEESKEQTVGQWLDDQGINEYNAMGELWKDLTLHPFLLNPKNELIPKQVEMFHMVCYNVDRFRDFLFDTPFFDRFKVADEIKEKIKADDIELLKFGCEWLRYALFGEKTLEVYPEAAKTALEKFEARKKKAEEREAAKKRAMEDK